MKTVYKFKGSQKPTDDAQRVGHELEATQRHNKDGLLVAHEVVSRARNEGNPLHKYFQWDDDVAAEEYRNQQARQLIRSVEVVRVSKNKETSLPAFISLTPDRAQERGGYQNIQTVMSSSQKQRQMLTDAHKAFLSFRRKYEHLSKLRPLFDVADQVWPEEQKDEAG